MNSGLRSIKHVTTLLVALTLYTIVPSAPAWSEEKERERDELNYSDYDDWVLTVSSRFFRPTARIYFDTGSDDENEVDAFTDGALTANVDLLEFYVAAFKQSSEFTTRSTDLSRRLHHRTRWSVGPMFGLGMTGPAQNSEDGTQEASGAPVFMVNYGLYSEIALTAPEQQALSKNNISGPVTLFVEGGRVTAFSTDEALDDFDDSALFFGVGVTVPFGFELWAWGEYRR
jgi:hypothetical protein